MPKETTDGIKLPSLDELFSSEEERKEAKLKKIEEIPLELIDPFPDHPFKVKNDEDMENLIESIRAKGVLTPCMVRNKKDGRYELVSGHRRKHACEMLGIDTLPCEVVDLSKAEATIIMVESNFQRSQILPSEKAFAYKMRLEAMKQNVSRMVENQRLGHNFKGAPVGPQLANARDHLSRAYGIPEDEVRKIGTPESRKHQHGVSPMGTRKIRSTDYITAETGDSKNQIYRYIRLTELIPELLTLVDEGKIGIRPAVELSYLESRQRDVFEVIDMEQCTPTHAQAKRMRSLYQEGKLTPEVIEVIMTEEKPNQKERIVLRGDRFRNLFPKDLPLSQREDYVAAAMEHYGKYLARKERGQER